MDDQWPDDKIIALIDVASGLPISQSKLDELSKFKARIQKGEARPYDKFFIVVLCKKLLRKNQVQFSEPDREPDRIVEPDREPDHIVVKTYARSKADTAERDFRTDAIELAKRGYYPISQSWAQGEWSKGAYLIGVLLIFLFGLGFLILGYMLIVKPEGSLTVTYELRAVPVEEKTCPMCAERVKAAALVCHFCGHEFAPAGEAQKGPSQTPAPR